MTTPDPKNVDVMRRELDIQIQLQERLTESADVRAGIVLGFAGVVAGIAAAATVFAIPGAVVAGWSVVRAAMVLLPRQLLTTLDPTYMTNTLKAKSPETTAWAVYRSRLADYQKNQTTVQGKLAHLRSAVLFLSIGTGLVLAGVAAQTIVNFFVGEEGTQP